ncbi:MAG: hypothetical protein R3253_05730 [Longimicrobiales bacterium]|nr:hypothetical protein [Longimicrobiales bacterium]
MANQITDNRTLVDSADSATPYDSLSGAAAGTLDTDIKVQGSGSVSGFITNSLAGILYDAGSAQNWANNVFYVWVNCGIVGLLDTKANGGFRIRFCGATVTDFFEFYVGGSDSWPTAVEGGWVQFVVDIEATPSNTGGTPPATSAVRYVGWAGVTGGTMPKMVDNTWIDEIRRLPDGNPGVIIEGQNNGPTDWSWEDVISQLGVGVGTVKLGPGGSIVLNTPVQFGINDATTHGFSDTNKILLWENQEFAPSDLYKLSALGNSGGTTNVTFGVKTGTGDDATGAQGVTIAAAAGGVRWAMDFDDPNLDAINFYGCSLQHGGDFQLDNSAVSCISTAYVDCSSAVVSNSEQLRCKVIDANTADGVAFMTTDDLGDLVFCEFEFSDGHAIELTTPRVANQTSKGNRFSGYALQAGNANDRAIYNNTAGAVAISVTSGGVGTEHSYRNGTSASTTVNANTNVTFTGMKDNTEVRVYDAGDGSEIAGIENATAGSPGNRSFTWSDASGNVVDYVVHSEAYETIRVEGYTVPGSDASIPIQQRIDRNYANP